MIVKRLARGAEAFLTGHGLAKAVARGDKGLGDVERFVRQEDAVTLAVTGAGAAATAWFFVKRRELLLLWALGALVGSGILQKVVHRMMGDRLEEMGVEDPSQVEVRVLQAGDGRDLPDGADDALPRA